MGLIAPRKSGCFSSFYCVFILSKAHFAISKKKIRRKFPDSPIVWAANTLPWCSRSRNRLGLSALPILCCIAAKRFRHRWLVALSARTNKLIEHPTKEDVVIRVHFRLSWSTPIQIDRCLVFERRLLMSIFSTSWQTMTHTYLHNHLMVSVKSFAK